MDRYEKKAKIEMENWKRLMQKKPNIVDTVSKETQRKLNSILPNKYHEFLTITIKNFTKAVLFGSKYVSKPPMKHMTLLEREKLLKTHTEKYTTTATIEGAATGAGGIVLGLSDFPLLLSIKMKYLYDVASIYGFDMRNYYERLYVLHVFQLAFSSKKHMNKIFHRLEHWDEYIETLPNDLSDFEWREFQEEYRDYMDLAKLLQLMPGIGAFVGSYVNNKLMKRLHTTAKNAYRMRILS